MCPSKISCMSSSSKSGKGVLKHNAIFLKSAESYGLYKHKLNYLQIKKKSSLI